LAASELPVRGALASVQPRTSVTKHMFITPCTILVNEASHFADRPAVRQLGSLVILVSMLFMVIEHFRQGNAEAVGARFKSQGRMLPGSVIYHVSWMETTGARCYQIMEAPSREALGEWIGRWDDLVDFEVVPVLTSVDYWSQQRS